MALFSLVTCAHKTNDLHEIRAHGICSTSARVHKPSSEQRAEVGTVTHASVSRI